MDQQSNWRWMRVYYFDRCKDDVLLKVVEPAARMAKERYRGYQYFFQRDWFRGPNVLLGSRCTDGLHDPAADVARMMRELLEAFPSLEEFSESEYASMCQRLARWEAKQDYSDLSLRANNSVAVDEPEPVNSFVLDPGLKEVGRNLLALATPHVLHWLALCRDGALTRDLIAMKLMVSLVWLADSELLRPYISFNSHASAFLNAADLDGSLKHKFEEIYISRKGEEIRELIRSTIGGLQRGTSEDEVPHLSNFTKLLQSTLLQVFDGLETHRLQPVDAHAFFAGQAFTPRNVNIIQALNGCHEWRAWQITVSLFYQVLNQLGISPTTRFLACYLLGRGMEEVSGESQDRILDLVQRRPSCVFTFTHTRQDTERRHDLSHA